MIQFRKYIETDIEIDDEEWSELECGLKSVNYQKGDIISRAGDVAKHLLFMKSGIVRSYLIDSQGKDFTWNIHFAGEAANIKNLFVVDYASLISQEPSKLHFEVLADASLIQIDLRKMSEALKSQQKLILWGKKMADTAYYFTHHRAISLLTESAEVRYKRLLDDNPILLQKVSQHYIASYLGITAQSLSRIRNKISQ